MKCELIRNLPREDYDKRKEANFSRIRLIQKSPLHYKWNAEEGGDDSDAMKLGRCGHLAILEPDEYEQRVVVWTGGNRTGKKWDAFREEHCGKEILTVREAERIEGMKRAVHETDWVRPFLTDGERELTLVWETEVIPGLMLPCRGRLDYVTAGAIVDLKLTRNSSPEAFGRQAWDGLYLAQAAFYSDGYFACTGMRMPFYFAAVENTEPFVPAIYEVTEAHLAAGRTEYMRLLATLSICEHEQKWPGYTLKPMPLQLPRWAQWEADETLNAENQEAAQ